MKHIVMISVLLLGIWMAPALAQNVPDVLDHQGFLTDAQGIPVTGSQLMVFRIYDTSTNGSELWSESLQVDVDAGLYHVLLGETNSLQGVINGSARYLAIDVAGDGEMSPRLQLVSVAHALVSGGAHIDQTCPGGQAVVGFDASGAIICQ